MRVAIPIAVMLAFVTTRVRAQTMTVKGVASATAVVQHVKHVETKPIPGTARASATLYPWTAIGYASASASGLTVSFEAWGAVMPPSTQASGSGSVGGEIVYRADKPMPGLIENNGSAIIRVGNRTHTGSTRIAVTLSSKPLVVSFNTLFFGGKGSIGFVPMQNPIVSSYGPECDAKLIGGWSRQNRTDTYEFEVSNAPNTPFVFLLLGTRRLALPLPPSNCQLLTDFPIGIPLMIKDGRAVVSLKAPALVGVLNAQVLGSERPLPNVFWRTSNGVQFRLPR